MKLKSGQIPSADQFKKASALLVFGSDLGAIDEIVKKTVHFFETSDNLMELIEINTEKLKKTPSLFWDEVNAYSMLSHQRVIYYKNVPDSFVDEFRLFLNDSHPDTFLLMSSSTLKTSAALCKEACASDQVLAIGCYPQEAAGVKQTILSFMNNEGFIIHPDAVAFLTQSLGADKAVTMGELEKLKTYMGKEKQITLKDVQACIGNESLSNLEELIISAMTGNARLVQKNLKLLLQENVNPVTIVSAFIRKTQQIIQIISKRDAGTPLDTAISSTPPYIPFTVMTPFKDILQKWPMQQLETLLSLLMQTDKDLKSNLPPQTVLNQTLLRITNAGKNLNKPRF